MKILLIKTKNIGDALLMTAAARALRRDYPAAEITALVRAGTEGILRGAVSLNQVGTIGRLPESRRSQGVGFCWWKQGYDVAFDLGGTSAGRWAGLPAGRRSTRGKVSAFWRMFYQGWTQDLHGMHHAERDFRQVAAMIPLSDPVPALEFDPSRADWSLVERLPQEDYAVLHPATRWQEKRWPLEKWKALAAFMRDKGLHLVVSCGPAEEEVQFCRAMVADLPAGLVTLTEGRASWAQLAGLLWRARLFAGVDTAAMHLAAACQCPTVALMVYDPRHWGPWQVRGRVVHAPPDERLSRAERMQRIPVEESIQAAAALLTHGR